MPVGLSPVSVFRFVAGLLAALWAMAGLANNYATIAAAGPSFGIIITITINIFLTAGASLAFVDARGWRNVLLIALTCATIDRIVFAVNAGAAFQQSVGALIVFAVIAAVTLLGSRAR
jgi:inner membrane protein involved in colicin E2 resistance